MNVIEGPREAPLVLDIINLEFNICGNPVIKLEDSKVPVCFDFYQLHVRLNRAQVIAQYLGVIVSRLISRHNILRPGGTDLC